jgi:hypothetical protein
VTEKFQALLVTKNADRQSVEGALRMEADVHGKNITRRRRVPRLASLDSDEEVRMLHRIAFIAGIVGPLMFMPPAFAYNHGGNRHIAHGHHAHHGHR